MAILAAGASRRLGTAKQLVPIAGEALLRRQCRCALSARVGPVLVLLGYQAEQHRRVIADLPIEVRVTEGWQEGIAASLRHAVGIAKERRAASLVLPCDHYRITSRDLRTLHAVWRRAPLLACVSRWGDYVGPPAILPLECYDGVQRLRGDIGARRILYDGQRPPPQEVANVRASYDLDVRADIAIAQSLKRG